jgi:hypothetical protein
MEENIDRFNDLNDELKFFICRRNKRMGNGIKSPELLQFFAMWSLKGVLYFIAPKNELNQNLFYRK